MQEICIMYCESHVLQQVGTKSEVILWWRQLLLTAFALMKRLIYLSVLLKVEVEFIHILCIPS